MRLRAKAILAKVKAITGPAGTKGLAAMAAANIAAPAVAQVFRDLGYDVVAVHGGQTAAWRKLAGVAKDHATDAACIAAQGNPIRFSCEAPVVIEMGGRGRRQKVKVNGSGAQERRKDGQLVLFAGGRHAHGVAAGDVALWDREGVGRRRRVVQVAVARADGRCEVVARGVRYNAQASTLTILHRGQGARWETGQAPRTGYLQAPRPASG